MSAYTLRKRTSRSTGREFIEIWTDDRDLIGRIADAISSAGQSEFYNSNGDDPGEYGVNLETMKQVNTVAAVLGIDGDDLLDEAGIL